MKYYSPYIIFLDNDLQKSAQCFTNPHLELLIKRVNQILFCGLFYFIGVRNKKFYSYYFGKDRKKESIDKWFPNFPLKKFPPFTCYNSVESKWVRKCADHFQYLVDYLGYLLSEYSYRHGGKDHELFDMYDFHKNILVELSLTNGIYVPYANLKKIIIPWKNLDPRFRRKDIVSGYQKYYRTLIYDPFQDFADVQRDIPEFLIGQSY